MWDVLWHNAMIATMSDDQGFGLITDGAIGVVGGRITWIGPRSELGTDLHSIAHGVYNADGRVITPGLIDPHTHIVHTEPRWQEFAFRTGHRDEDIPKPNEFGLMSSVIRTRSTSENELLAHSMKRTHALIAEGVTTVEIKTGYGLDLETELKMARVIRHLADTLPITVISTFLGAHAIGPEFAGRPDEYIDFLCDVVLPVLVSHGLVDAVDIFCDARGFSHAQTRRYHQAARQHGLEFFIHADQYSNFGAGRLAAELRARAAAHLEHADAETAQHLAWARTTAVLLPGVSWTHNMQAVPPVHAFREHDVPMALATNCNPGSSVTTSPCTMMNMACQLFGLTVDEALAGFTRCAAQALGMQDERGTLEVGKWADLAIWNISHPAELSVHVGGGQCHAVVKAGKVIHVNQHLHVPECYGKGQTVA